MDTIARMQLPLRCLPQFLHETMHHWCFESPVGFAISLLQMRARRRAALAVRRSIRDSDRQAIAQDLARINGFLDFTRPLAEGMALFSEHDMQLGDSEVIGRPALFAGMMFAGRQKDSSDYLRLAPELIAAARLKPSHIRRKADLLLQPFSGSGEGYLAGYLYLKMLYRIVAERCASYSDTEFFLHTLRCLIYDDWDLVDLLLDDSIDYERWVEKMVLYCQQRVTAFIAIDERELRAFAQRGLTHEADEFEYHGPSLELRSYAHPVMAARDAQSGKKRLHALLDELFHREPKEAALKTMFASDLELLRLRTTVTLGHGTFEALVTDGKMLHLMTEGARFPVFATGAPSTLQRGWKEPVDVELLLTTAPFGLYQFIIGRAGMISSQSFGENEDVPDYLQTRMVNWEERHNKMDEEDRLVRDVLTDSSEEMILELTLGRVRETRKAIFELKGLGLVPDDMIESAQSMLSADGFLPVLEFSPTLMLDAALTTICVGLGINASEALPDWKWSFGTEQLSVEKINASFQAVLGYEPFLRSEGRAVFSMI